MNNDPLDREPTDGDDLDPGEPVLILADLEVDASSKFLDRIRRKIYRRTATSHIASFSWNAPKLILMEVWNALIQLLGPSRNSPKGGQS